MYFYVCPNDKRTIQRITCGASRLKKVVGEQDATNRHYALSFPIMLNVNFNPTTSSIIETIQNSACVLHLLLPYLSDRNDGSAGVEQVEVLNAHHVQSQVCQVKHVNQGRDVEKPDTNTLPEK